MKIEPNISHDFEIDLIKILNMETTIFIASFLWIFCIYLNKERSYW